MARRVLAFEGGYADEPGDAGGPTGRGISLATLRRLGRDLTGDGRIDAADARAVDEATAIDIILEHYWRRPRIDRLPDPLQPVVLDMAVNAGPAQAVRLLQRLLGEFGRPVAVDGLIGPRTAGVAAEVWADAGPLLVDAYAIARREWYYRLAERRPELRRFARRRDGGKGGWITRAESFMRPRFRLGEAEHARRVAGWS
ncbi:MAG: peptidoglycan-binding protein [Alphaproteobacteria bacterium]|nr:MAG: peptidoglycan-binding protein [Alphaproteobacteria bacterium]